MDGHSANMRGLSRGVGFSGMMEAEVKPSMVERTTDFATKVATMAAPVIIQSISLIQAMPLNSALPSVTLPKEAVIRTVAVVHEPFTTFHIFPVVSAR
jgi:hypothetical protein